MGNLKDGKYSNGLKGVIMLPAGAQYQILKIDSCRENRILARDDGSATVALPGGGEEDASGEFERDVFQRSCEL
ncbi:hypothetical protein N7540_001961 [Penicillium herquei]|nr:hypothetical protein N7540_001961 [Penicillium herquei]